MDYSLFFAVIFLLLFGLIMVYSASSYEASLKFNDSAFYLKNQARATALGFIAMLIISRIDYHIWKGPAFLIYLGSLFLVFLVLTPLGVVMAGCGYFRTACRGGKGGSDTFIRIDPFQIRQAVIFHAKRDIYLYGAGRDSCGNGAYHHQ